ncbi:uncharacterized protein LOC108813776 [Raphanus sativus]|uniref:Uncharacterized protein LOC108813776 n=1 Tax=Raphanus sativus TaxID=3726 RepID=A0A6J0K2Q7_RAPSA|nr:uncharacterized protein LOC108813776 [Raphanus sativus]
MSGGYHDPRGFSPERLLEDLQIQTVEIQRLFSDNHRLAEDRVLLDRELGSSKEELHRMSLALSELRAEYDHQSREFSERMQDDARALDSCKEEIHRMKLMVSDLRAEQDLQSREFSEKREEDGRAIESYKEENAELRGEVQKLNGVKRELGGDVEILRKDLVKLQSENKQVPGLRAEVQDLKKELMHARGAIEYEKKEKFELMEQRQSMENNMVSMAREVEKLRAELAAVDSRPWGYGGSYGMNFNNMDGSFRGSYGEHNGFLMPSERGMNLQAQPRNTGNQTASNRAEAAEILECTRSVGQPQNGANGQAQVPVGDTAAVSAAVLHGLKELFGPLLQQNSAGGLASRAAAVLQVQGGAGLEKPSPLVPATGPIPSYWDALRRMRDLGTETFGGGADRVAADNWWQLLERNFEFSMCPVEYRKELAAHYLREEAHIWWENVVQGTPEGYVLNWYDFKDEFARRYFPEEAIDQMDKDFAELRQGTRTVREYEQEFHRLRKFVSRCVDEREHIKKFVRGLRVDIKNRCQMRRYVSMVDLVETAVLMESNIDVEVKQARASQAPKGTLKRTWDDHAADSGTEQTSMSGLRGRKHVRPFKSKACYGCGLTGHIKRNCPGTQLT